MGTHVWCILFQLLCIPKFSKSKTGRNIKYMGIQKISKNGEKAKRTVFAKAGLEARKDLACSENERNVQ